MKQVPNKYEQIMKLTTKAKSFSVILEILKIQFLVLLKSEDSSKVLSIRLNSFSSSKLLWDESDNALEFGNSFITINDARTTGTMDVRGITIDVSNKLSREALEALKNDDIEALSLSKQSLVADPSNAFAWAVFGKILLKNGKVQESLNYFERSFRYRSV